MFKTVQKFKATKQVTYVDLNTPIFIKWEKLYKKDSIKQMNSSSIINEGTFTLNKKIFFFFHITFLVGTLLP